MAAEGAAAAFTAVLSGAVSSPVTLHWSTSDGTAAAGADYTAASGTFTFPANSTARQILSVTTLGDALAEGDETFAVPLTDSGLPAGVSLGTASATATGTILGEDELSASVWISDAGMVTVSVLIVPSVAPAARVSDPAGAVESAPASAVPDTS